MIRLQRMFTKVGTFPSTNNALLAILACPVLLAAACWQAPLPIQALHEIGLEVSTWQVFDAGFGAFCLMLCFHRPLNSRYFRRYSRPIKRHSTLVMKQQGMVVAGLTNTSEYRAVVEEKAALGNQLGWLVDADNFYQKFDGIHRFLSWLHRKM
ncbi:hypothetical protein AB7M31_004642 [Pseudomonas sp. IAP-CY TE4608]